ncbi:MAG: hypothetical protein LBN30_04960 [Oscillospiraceae bacterium]|nr:hypothetical protein [Oscillospiraceae bacterium]
MLVFKKAVAIALAAVMLFALAACNPKTSKLSNWNDTLPLLDTAAVSGKIAELHDGQYSAQVGAGGTYNVHFAVDSSLSMRNFMEKGCGTYNTILDAVYSELSGDRFKIYFVGEKTKEKNTKAEIVEGYKLLRLDGQYFADLKSAMFYNQNPKDDSDLYEPFKYFAEMIGSAPNDVYVYVGDMIAPKEAQVQKIVEYLSVFTQNKNMCVGIIGVLADYNGDIYDMPGLSAKESAVRTVQKSAVATSLLNENGVFQQPVYMMFMGNAENVYRELTEVKDAINAKISDRQLVQSYIISGLRVESNITTETQLKNASVSIEEEKFDYPIHDKTNSKSVFSEGDFSTYLSADSIPLFRVYEEPFDAAAEGGGNNLTVQFSAPYKVIKYPGGSEVTFDKTAYGAPKLSFNLYGTGEYAPEQVPEDEEFDGSYKVAAPIMLDISAQKEKFVGASIPFDSGSSAPKSVRFTLPVKPEYLILDEPILVTAQMTMAVSPTAKAVKDTLKADMQWLLDWELDIDAYRAEMNNGAKDGKANSYTQTGHTPYIGALFERLTNEKAEAVTAELPAQSGDFGSIAVFGFVKRGFAKNYYSSGKDSDPDRVAFTQSETRDRPTTAETEN